MNMLQVKKCEGVTLMIANREINFEQDIEASLVQNGGWSL